MARTLKTNKAKTSTDKPAVSTGGNSFADRLNKLKDEKGFKSLPIGKHGGFIFDGEIQDGEDDDTKKAILSFRVSDDGENYGNNQKLFFNLKDAEGEPHVGAQILMRTLETLEVFDSEETEFESEEHFYEILENIFEDIRKEPLYVQVVSRKKNGYVNLIVDKLLDQENAPEFPDEE